MRNSFLLVLLFGCQSNPAMEPSAVPVPSYDRGEWGRWADDNKDGQATRQEVLIEESEISVTFKTERNCKVASGRWTCPYTGTVYTDPSELDIDHTIPLREVHYSGGYLWTKDQKKLYFNGIEPEHLVAVSASANRSKGSRRPDEWMPVINECKYLKDWMKIKGRWGLDYGCEEAQIIVQLVGKFCSD